MLDRQRGTRDAGCNVASLCVGNTGGSPGGRATTAMVGYGGDGAEAASDSTNNYDAASQMESSAGDLRQPDAWVALWSRAVNGGPLPGARFPPLFSLTPARRDGLGGKVPEVADAPPVLIHRACQSQTNLTLPPPLMTLLTALTHTLHCRRRSVSGILNATRKCKWWLACRNGEKENAIIYSAVRRSSAQRQ